MRKLIIATTALAFLSSTTFVPSIAFAQDKGAQSDTMSKGEMSKMKKTKKTKKSSSMKKEDTTK